MSLASHFDIIESRILIVGYRDIFCEKNFKFFRMCGGKYSCKNWNVYEVHIFSRPLLQTCRLETTSFCLNTRLLLKKYFQILIIFIEINVNVCLLCAHHVMTSIILHTRRQNCQYNVCYGVGFMFQLIFWHFEELKSTFFTSFHFAPRGVY